MKIKYRDIHLSKDNLTRLDEVNIIIASYQAQGYRLTLRQLYYQLVSRDVIPNKVAEYAKLSNLLKEGRMAGIVDWEAIEDRLRKPDKPSCWNSPLDIMNSCVQWYRRDRMTGQPSYIEVWVEKDALSGVLKRVTEEYGINIIVNRGYSSTTAMHDAHRRFLTEMRKQNACEVKVIYIGDFDPSGQDMIRDVTDRIQEFDGSYDFTIIPIALTWDQIQEYDPPTNPAKITDPRAAKYIAQYGEYSWEVDALPPEKLHRILRDKIGDNLDSFQYEEMIKEEIEHKNKLKELRKQLESDEEGE